MRKTTSLLVVLALGCGGLGLAAAAADGPKPAGASVTAAELNAVLAMAPEQRRAHLQSLTPQERWQLKAAITRARSSATDTRYATMTPRRVETKAASSKAARAIGTITYDDGSGTTTFGGGAIIGNRFNTHTGIPVVASGSVSMIQAVVVPGPGSPIATTNNVQMIVCGPQAVAGGAAAALYNASATATGTLDVVTMAGLAVNYTGNSFFVMVGDNAGSYVPVFDTGTALGQGHHGMVGYTGGNWPNITSTFDFGDAFNGLVRASGNIVPVELQSFDAE